MSKFFIKLTAITIPILLAAILISHFSDTPIVHPYIYWIVLYFVTLTAGTYFFVVRGLRKDLFALQNRYTASLALRLVLSAACLILYIMVVKTDKTLFVINFFALYFLYTIFEIRSILSNLRAHLKNEKKEDESLSKKSY